MSFGQELRAAREATGLSIQQLAQQTKIRGDYLRALEAEEVAVLPERTFGRAYLQSYARALNLDETGLLRDFDRLMPPPAEQVRRAPAQKPRRSVRRGAAGVVGGVAAGVVLLGVAGYFGYTAYTSRSPAAPATQERAAAPVSTQVRFSVSSTPAGARVYIDNRYLGLTPVQDFPLDARPQGTLRVEYGGRQSYRQTVNLQKNQHLQVSLAPLSAAQLAAQAVAAQPATGQQAGGAQGAARPAVTPPAATPPATGQPTTSQPAPAQTPAAPPATTAVPAGSVKLSWVGTSWTRVTGPGGQVLYQGIPARGSSRVFPAGVTVRTGSAGLVTATVGGGAPRALGAVGQVVTRKF